MKLTEPFLKEKTAGKLVFLRVRLQSGFRMISEPFHVTSNKPMNGFSWIHGTVLLILAGLYSLHNR